LFVFHLILKMCPAKHVFSNTSGNRLIVKAYVLKVCLFLLFWTIIGGRIWSIVIANNDTKSHGWYGISRYGTLQSGNARKAMLENSYST
jgi:prolipoprotein diacylglyceryltransferase